MEKRWGLLLQDGHMRVPSLQINGYIVGVEQAEAHCWGAGGLGNGSTSSSVPVAVSQGALPAGGVVRSISVGDYRACVIASDNRPYCWGSDTGSNIPVAIGQGQMPSPTVDYINDGQGQTTCA